MKKENERRGRAKRDLEETMLQYKSYGLMFHRWLRAIKRSESMSKEDIYRKCSGDFGRCGGCIPVSKTFVNMNGKRPRKTLCSRNIERVALVRQILEQAGGFWGPIQDAGTLPALLY